MKLSNIKYNFLNIIIYLLLLFTFSLSVYSKIISIDSFYELINGYDIFKEEILIIIVNTVIALEIFVVYHLIFSPNSKITYYIIILLLICFQVVLILTFIFKGNIDCKCFGELLSLNIIESVIKNLIMIFLAYYNLKTIKIEYNNQNVKKYIYLVEFISIYSLCIFTFDINFKFHQNFQNIRTIEKLEVINSNYLIIDARDNHKFQNYHIHKAINIPYNFRKLNELEKNYIRKYVKDKNGIVVYCDSDMCSLSRYLAMEIIKGLKINKVFVLEGGLELWGK